jgi:hypothetical protein
MTHWTHDDIEDAERDLATLLATTRKKPTRPGVWRWRT